MAFGKKKRVDFWWIQGSPLWNGFGEALRGFWTGTNSCVCESFCFPTETRNIYVTKITESRALIQHGCIYFLICCCCLFQNWFNWQVENPKNREMSYEVASSNKRVYVWDVAAEKVQVRWSMMEHGRYGCCFFTNKKGMHWVVPPPSNSGKWRFIGVPY